MDDWERITQIDPNMLVTLPRSPNVHDIIAEYLESKAKRTTQASQEKLSELFEGLRIYFDAALPVMLLYRQERAQYDELLKQDPEMMPSKVYGVEHLLRAADETPIGFRHGPTWSLRRHLFWKGATTGGTFS